MRSPSRTGVGASAMSPSSRDANLQITRFGRRRGIIPCPPQITPCEPEMAGIVGVRPLGTRTGANGRVLSLDAS